jgi:hypothetical protein
MIGSTWFNNIVVHRPNPNLCWSIPIVAPSLVVAHQEGIETTNQQEIYHGYIILKCFLDCLPRLHCYLFNQTICNSTSSKQQANISAVKHNFFSSHPFC